MPNPQLKSDPKPRARLRGDPQRRASARFGVALGLSLGSADCEYGMKLEFKRLKDIDCSEIIVLNTNRLVMRQMPLSDDHFDKEECQKWVEGKEKQWEDYGYGPWAFVIDGNFAGWGGFQYEDGDADLGLVLHPNYWGAGKLIYDEMIKRGFGELGFESVTILFPPSRTRIKGILKLGFQPDGEVELGGERFIRYRLYAPQKQTS